MNDENSLKYNALIDELLDILEQKQIPTTPNTTLSLAISNVKKLKNGKSASTPAYLITSVRASANHLGPRKSNFKTEDQNFVIKIRELCEALIDTYYANVSKDIVYLVDWSYTDYDDVRFNTLGIFRTREEAMDVVDNDNPSNDDGEYIIHQWPIGFEHPIRFWTYIRGSRELS